MYLGIDIGGSKTLVAIFDDQGAITQQQKFPTPQDYQQFLQELKTTVAALSSGSFQACAIGMPGLVDRKAGVSVSSGPNLAWRNSPIGQDVSQLFGCPVRVENDANVAGLSEALLVKDQYNRVLYVTVSTGIGGGVVFNGQLEPALLDSEVGQMVYARDGKIMRWEEFASGKALVETYGKRASDITDDMIWQKVAQDLAVGLLGAAAILNPLDAIIIGGGVGSHFDRFGHHITRIMEEHSQNTVRKSPTILPAQHAEQAVIYGCYQLARQVHGQTA